MSLYYPQAAMTLRVMWEDFGNTENKRLQEVYSLPILVRRVVVNINDYTQADTFDAEIDYKQFPFDPRSIRACGVTISIQNMKQLYSGLQTPEIIKASSSNIIFMGFADEESVSFDDSKRTVRMEGRDYTALLIDRKYLSPHTTDITQPANVLIQGIIDELPELSKIKVVVQPEDLEIPVMSKFTAYADQPFGGQRSRQNDESYWDVIHDIATRSGLIAYMERDKVILTKPRALYNKNLAVQMIFGKNIKNLTYKRKLGRKKNFNIAVRSLNTHLKDAPVLTAEIPLEATDAWSKATGIPQKRVQIPAMNVETPTPGNLNISSPGGTATPVAKTDAPQTPPRDAPIMGFLIPDITNKGELIERGQEIYEELSRQQIEGSFETKEMEGVTGQGEYFNLLNIRNATPVKITLDQGDLKGLSNIGRDSITKKTHFLISRGYQSSVAHALAESLSNERIDAPFYTKNAQFTLDAERGFSLKIDFLNFIELPKKLRGTA